MQALEEEYIWIDNEIKRYSDYKVGLLNHSLQYGSGIFEGIRSYATEDGVAVFRLGEHIERLINSARIYHINISYTKEQIEAAVKDLIRLNKLNDSYIRPFIFYNSESIGLNPYGKKVSLAIVAIEMGSYFKNKDSGIRCIVSSWRRIDNSILPPMAKASGNYINSILASLEAHYRGADEAVMLNSRGYVSEGPGENIFLVKGDKLITPSLDSNILEGITRDTIIKIAKDLDIEVIERVVNREELYTADELFFCGTAAEITPIISVDDIEIKNKDMPITKKISKYYSDIVRGKVEKYKSMLTYVG
ncbi:MAG: putative branched-chain-amino-acid aminotransferase [Candidatus Micrarchaeota archaeon]|nr:MAG: putative branched-chain-amino-acid aminotransferase [Candidatus Micrarchaeota archaeon]